MKMRITTILALLLGLVAARAAAQCDVTEPCAPAEVWLELHSTTGCVGWLSNGTGDDGCNPSPPATRYEIRMSTSPINDFNWSSLPIAGNGLFFASTDQQHNFDTLTCNTTYYFVLFFFDEADNRSPPSYRSGTTLACGSPIGLCDNELESEDLNAPCTPTDPTVEMGTTTAYVQWNNDSSGDDGLCEGLPSKWELRQAPFPITDLNYTRAGIVCRSTVVGSGLQGRNLSGLTCNTTYYWALFFFDEMGNRSGGVFRSGTTLSCGQSLDLVGEYDYGLPCCLPSPP